MKKAVERGSLKSTKEPSNKEVFRSWDKSNPGPENRGGPEPIAMSNIIRKGSYEEEDFI